MTKAELKEKLASVTSGVESLPDGFTFERNELRNLAILNTNGDYVGYIDFTAGEVELQGQNG